MMPGEINLRGSMQPRLGVHKAPSQGAIQPHAISQVTALHNLDKSNLRYQRDSTRQNKPSIKKREKDHLQLSSDCCPIPKVESKKEREAEEEEIVQTHQNSPKIPIETVAELMEMSLQELRNLETLPKKVIESRNLVQYDYPLHQVERKIRQIIALDNDNMIEWTASTLQHLHELRNSLCSIPAFGRIGATIRILQSHVDAALELLHGWEKEL